MLKPAIIYKDEIERKFNEQLYTQDFFYYTGYDGSTYIPEIKREDFLFQYAIIDSSKPDGQQLIGYFSYSLNTLSDTINHFGLYSFDRGNYIIGRDIAKKMRELVRSHHRVEWRMIDGNPVKRHYDRFCQRFGGSVVKLHEVVKAPTGEYVDEYIYEIINGGKQK